MSKTEEKNVTIRVLAPEYVPQQEINGKPVDIRSGIVVRGAFVMPGSTCEVKESDAKDLILRGRAELA